MRYSLIPIVFVLVFTVSCAGKVPRAVVHEDGKSTRKSEVFGKAVFDFLEATRTVKALVKVESSQGEEVRRLDAAVVVQRPSSIRVDMMDVVASVWAKAGGSGGKVWFYLPAKGRLYTGRAVKKNINKLMQFGVEMDEIVALVTGAAPVREGEVVMQTGKGGELHFTANEGRVHMWPDEKKPLRLVKCARYEEDGSVMDYIAEYKDFRKVGGVDFPYMIDIKFPKTGARLSIEFTDVTLGSDVDANVFEPGDARGKKTIDLEKEK